MRAVLDILLAVAVLTGAARAIAAQGDVAANEVITSCCATEPAPLGPDGRNDRDGRSDCDASCSACCKSVAVAAVTSPSPSALQVLGHSLATAERLDDARRLELPLRPPRGLL